MEITYKVTRKNFSINIPLELLRHIAENHPEFSEGLKVKNIGKLATYIGEKIIDSEPETGLKGQIDDCIVEAVEDAEPFLKDLGQDDDE